jgi:hypothetical protein
MATSPSIDTSRVLALTPTRANIFAKPTARTERRANSDPRPGGVFDESAACASDRHVDGSGSAPLADALKFADGGSTLSRSLRRTTCLLAVCGLIATLVIVLPSGGHRAAERHAPASPVTRPLPPTKRVTPRERRAPGPAVVGRGPKHRRAPRHRPPPPDRRPTSHPTPSARRSPIAPQAAPRAPVERNPAPPPPLPARVPDGAPPEFM